MATIRIQARNLRVGHVLAVTGETVARRISGDKPVAVELLGTDGVKRAMTYAADVMVTVEVDEEDGSLAGAKGSAGHTVAARPASSFDGALGWWAEAWSMRAPEAQRGFTRTPSRGKCRSSLGGSRSPPSERFVSSSSERRQRPRRGAARESGG